MEEPVKEMMKNWQKVQTKAWGFWNEALVPSAPNEMIGKLNEFSKDVWQACWNNQEAALKLWTRQVQIPSLMQAFSPRNQSDKMSEMFGSLGNPEQIKGFYQDWFKMMSGGMSSCMKPSSDTSGEDFEK